MAGLRKLRRKVKKLRLKSTTKTILPHTKMAKLIRRPSGIMRRRLGANELHRKVVTQRAKRHDNPLRNISLRRPRVTSVRRPKPTVLAPVEPHKKNLRVKNRLNPRRT
jgi:hypothetical protein